MAMLKLVAEDFCAYPQFHAVHLPKKEMLILDCINCVFPHSDKMGCCFFPALHSSSLFLFFSFFHISSPTWLFPFHSVILEEWWLTHGMFVKYDLQPFSCFSRTQQKPKWIRTDPTDREKYNYFSYLVLVFVNCLIISTAQLSLGARNSTVNSRGCHNGTYWAKSLLLQVNCICSLPSGCGILSSTGVIVIFSQVNQFKREREKYAILGHLKYVDKRKASVYHKNVSVRYQNNTQNIYYQITFCRSCIGIKVRLHITPTRENCLLTSSFFQPYYLAETPMQIQAIME